MGSDKHYPEEAPAHRVTVDGFWIDEHPVTNEQFSRFVHETGHVTFAERTPCAEDYPDAKPELMFAGSVVFRKPKMRVDLDNCYNWWSYVRGANWRHPDGPRSTLKGKAKHPVVHIAHQDAVAYADWRLAEAPSPADVVFGAIECGCRGVLVDTFAKTDRRLLDWLTPSELQDLARTSHASGLWFAVAGRLNSGDLARLTGVGHDIVGFRSAACREGLREGEIDPAAVSRLKACLTGFRFRT